MEKTPVILFGTARAPAAKGDRPKVVAAGEVRNRIPCTLPRLQALDAEASPDILAKALQVVNGVNLDDHHFDDVVRFGIALQTEHAALTQAELDLVSADGLASVKADYLELIGRLDRLDPKAVFDTGTAPLQRLARFFRFGVTEQSFAQDYAGITALAQAIEAAMPAIDDRVATLEQLSRRYAGLSQSLRAHVLACRFILAHIDTAIAGDGHLAAHYRSQRDALEARHASLSASCLTVEIGQQTLKILSQEMAAFGVSGHALTREDLPAWHAAFSAALLARRFPTQDTGLDAGSFDAVVRAHHHLVSKLKRKEAP